MLTSRGNYHHSKLPALGAIGYLVMGFDRFNEPQYYRGSRQRYRVLAYPLNDNVSPYSRGIHTAFFEDLGRGETVRLSGFYFEPE